MERWLFGACFCIALVGCNAQPDETGARSSEPVPAASTSSGAIGGRIVSLNAEKLRGTEVAVVPVQRGEFREQRDFPGTVTPNEHVQADIMTLVRGRVVDAYADLGQEVQGGDLLAILNSHELGMAQSAYLKANAKLYVAERAYERAKSLLQEKVIGVAEAQRREGDVIAIRAEAREAHDRLLLLGMDEHDIQRLAKEQTIRSHVPIVAPFAGRIIARNLTRGEVVETTQRLYVLADLSNVWVLANVPEKDIPYVPRTEGAPAEVRLTAYPDEVFHGKITYVGDVLNPASRTMQIRLQVPNPERKLKPEMYATVRISSEGAHSALLIPDGAVQRIGEKTVVFVQRDDGRYEVREVQLGDSNGAVTKILSGLNEGEPVVARGAFILKSELLSAAI